MTVHAAQKSAVGCPYFCRHVHVTAKHVQPCVFSDQEDLMLDIQVAMHLVGLPDMPYIDCLEHHGRLPGCM